MARQSDRFVFSSKSRFKSFKPLLETLEDRCVLDAWGLNLDFSTPTSPVGQGYQQVLLQKYTPQTGLGWSDLAGLSAVDRTNSTATDLNRAFHAGQRGTFLVNVPNGEYQVSLRFGDPAGAASGISGVIENRYVFMTPPTSMGQMFDQTFKVTVNDNQLSLFLLSRGGVKPYFALNSMKIVSTKLTSPPNLAPTNLVLSNSSIQENQPTGTLIGSLSTTDPNTADKFTYSLVGGTGSTDNAQFTINGNQLTTNSVFDFESQATRSVRIRTTDGGGLNFEKAFTINVMNVNEAPTSLALSKSTMDQTTITSFVVGQFSTTDTDVGDTFTYKLVTGTGIIDNTKFVIQGNTLKTNVVLAPGSYTIRVRTTDARGLFTEQPFTITVNSTTPNQPPTDILLSSSTIQENVATGAQVGVLSSIDPNVNDQFTYTLVSGTGSTDNGLFAISGNQLVTNIPLDFEAQASRSVRIRTIDGGGLSFEKVFTINVLNVNESPTSINLSNNIIPSTAASGTQVGLLSTSDPDQGDTFTYSLVPGTGSTNNTKFSVQGNSLKTNATLTPGSYSVLVRSTDAGGLFTERVLIVSVSGAVSNLLINKTNLQYVGAFRVPNYSDNVDEFSYGGTAIAFNPANNSLFMVGHYQSVTEISIPSTIANSSNLNTLATATMLQPWVQLLPRLSNRLTGTLDGAPIGGLIVDNGKLIGTQYAYYSGADTQTASHFVVDSLNLSTANVQGLYQVGSMARTVAGYMTPVPVEWQTALGAPYLTGQADLSIISTVSSGPAAFGFDPSQLNGPVTTSIPTTPYLFYPLSNPLGSYVGPANPLQSGTTSVNGIVFVPGSRSVLFFGKTGTNYNGYGTPEKYGDLNSDGGTGEHALNGEYAYQVWAYDANDFVAVKQGLKQPWEVRPYNTWNFDFPISSGFKQIGGVAFDPSSGRIYVSTMRLDHGAPYIQSPLVEVFQINLTPPTSPLEPQIGTLAATPSSIQPGAVQIGTLMTLTAGNVYSIQSGNTITQVAFYLDSNSNGILDQGVDQLLGYGTPLDISHNTTLQLSTSNLSSGQHTIFAQALDSGNLLGNTIATSFTLL